MELIFFPPEMAGQDQHADDRGNPCGKCSACHTQPERKDKYIIQYNIGQAAYQHGCHGQLWLFVIAYKTDQQIVQHEHGRKHEQNAQIYPRERQNGLIRTQKGCNLIGKQQACQKEQGGQYRYK